MSGQSSFVRTAESDPLMKTAEEAPQAVGTPPTGDTALPTDAERFERLMHETQSDGTAQSDPGTTRALDGQARPKQSAEVQQQRAAGESLSDRKRRPLPSSVAETSQSESHANQSPLLLADSAVGPGNSHEGPSPSQSPPPTVHRESSPKVPLLARSELPAEVDVTEGAPAYGVVNPSALGNVVTNSPQSELPLHPHVETALLQPASVPENVASTFNSEAAVQGNPAALQTDPLEHKESTPNSDTATGDRLRVITDSQQKGPGAEGGSSNQEGNHSSHPGQSLGDNILQSLEQQAVSAETGTENSANTRLLQYADQVARQILVTEASSPANQEVRIIVKESILPDTEVLLSHDGPILVVRFITGSDEASRLLTAHQHDLQNQLTETLDRAVSVDVSSDQQDGRSRGQRDPYSELDEEEN